MSMKRRDNLAIIKNCAPVNWREYGVKDLRMTKAETSRAFVSSTGPLQLSLFDDDGAPIGHCGVEAPAVVTPPTIARITEGRGVGDQATMASVAAVDTAPAMLSEADGLSSPPLSPALAAQRHGGSPPATMGQLLATTMARQRRGEATPAMSSAIRRFGTIVGRNLDDISVDPPSLAVLMAQVVPAAAGVSPRYWGIIRSLVSRALREGGTEHLPGKCVVDLTPAWAAFSMRLPNKAARTALSRFMRFLVSQGIEPGETRPAHFEEFRKAVFEKSLLLHPSQTYRTAVKQWNRLAESGAVDFTVQFEPDPRLYALPLSEFPPTFAADLEAFLGRGRNSSPFDDDYFKPPKATTLASWRSCLIQVASAAVIAGAPITALTDLAALVDPAVSKPALRHLYDRRNEFYKGLEAQLHVLLIVAKHWVKSPVALEVLGTLKKGVPKRAGGLTKKNRERLRQFDLRDNLEALVRSCHVNRGKPNGGILDRLRRWPPPTLRRPRRGSAEASGG
jgi:hypothetical protein